MQTLKWYKKKPDSAGWWWEWTGLPDDCPELIYVVFMGSPEGSGLAWYRGTREKMPLLGGPYYAGPILPPNVPHHPRQPGNEAGNKANL
jgi:hypothetical protein